ncbi:MAG: FAD-binding oxidoreductase [Candidatus Binataceae bacterium]
MTDTAKIADWVASLVGNDSLRAPRGLETRAATVIAAPADVGEIAELVRKCEADRISIAAIGAARTLSEIRRAPVAIGISLERMARVIAYEPHDMTIVAEPGISVAALNAAIAPSAQRLPIDPRNPEATTLGAMIAAHQAGPLRLSEGTARDLLIGIQYVGHGGRTIRSGGRVVKNVAGYDLMKLMNGSFGTLGIITEVSFKVRPIPGNYAVAIAAMRDVTMAFAAAHALSDAAPFAHLEITSPQISAALGREPRYFLWAGFSGTQAEVAYLHVTSARSLDGPIDFFAGAEATNLYCALRDFDFGAANLAAQIAVPPAELARVLEESGAEFRAHAGSGIAQIVTRNPLSVDAASATVLRWRQLARGAGGHLRVLHASAAIRAALEFFDSPNDGALKLMHAMKAAFDPGGIFNPGCFVGGT